MSWQRINLGADEYGQPTEPPATCGLIYRGKRHAISGPPEAAKTLAAMIVGLEHMRSGHGPFALIDFEMGEHATRLMLHDLGATIEEIRAVYYVSPTAQPETADLDALETAGVSLVVIDAAAGAYGASVLDDNKRADAEIFAASWINPLWKRGIATILIDHVVKNSDARSRYAIGSERKLGAVDVHLGLEVIKQLHRGHDGLIRILTHKDRPAHLARPHAADLHLRSDPDTHRITWEIVATHGNTAASDAEFRPTVLMERVSAYLERQSDPVSRNTIARDVTGKREYILKAIDALIDDGHATAEGTSGRIRHLSRYPVPEVVPGGSRNQDGGPVPGSLPLQGGTGTGTTHATASGKSGSRNEDELERLAHLGRGLGL